MRCIAKDLLHQVARSGELLALMIGDHVLTEAHEDAPGGHDHTAPGDPAVHGPQDRILDALGRTAFGRLDRDGATLPSGRRRSRRPPVVDGDQILSELVGAATALAAGRERAGRGACGSRRAHRPILARGRRALPADSNEERMGAKAVLWAA